MEQGISLKSERKTHDLNHDLTFSAHTIKCVCHSIRSMFRVLGIYNFARGADYVHQITASPLRFENPATSLLVEFYYLVFISIQALTGIVI